MKATDAALRIVPIGNVARGDDGIRVCIDPEYRAGLTGLGQFSHVIVFW